MAEAPGIHMDGNDAPIDTPNSQGRRAHYTWFRGEGVDFMPDLARLCSPDAALRHVVEGHAPAEPFISPASSVTAFGSCFAANIANWLHGRNYNVETKKEGDAYVIRCGEGMVNTFTILGQFRWAWEGRRPEGTFWHGYDAEEFGYDEGVREATRAIFDKTDVFILTFGLSEIWYDEPTGEVFWRAVPADKYDPARHKFRMSTVDENRQNLLEIFRLIRQHRPQAKIIVSLSPIPLVATFRREACITANSVSKATLRVAIDEAVRAAGAGVHYWPSYEFVLDFFNNPWRPDRRHVRQPVLDFIMTAFERVYATRPPTEEEFRQRLVGARIADGTLPSSLTRALKTRDGQKIEQILGRLADTPMAGLAPLVREFAAHPARAQRVGAWAAEISRPKPRKARKA